MGDDIVECLEMRSALGELRDFEVYELRNKNVFRGRLASVASSNVSVAPSPKSVATYSTTPLALASSSASTIDRTSLFRRRGGERRSDRLCGNDLDIDILYASKSEIRKARVPVCAVSSTRSVVATIVFRAEK